MQVSRGAVKHARIAKKLKASRIVIGECEHAHRALITVAGRVLAGDLDIPQEGCLSLLEKIIRGGRLRLGPERTTSPLPFTIP